MFERWCGPWSEGSDEALDDPSTAEALEYFEFLVLESEPNF